MTTRYFCADSARYEEKILKWLTDPERAEGPTGTIGFTISADMSDALRRVCQAVAPPSMGTAQPQADALRALLDRGLDRLARGQAGAADRPGS